MAQHGQNSKLKEANGKWVKKLVISESLWKQMKKETFAGIFAIMQSVNIILEHIKHPSHVRDNTLHLCAGLYSFALEEYGKLLILQEYTPVNGQVTIDYADKFRNHEAKFKKALSALPADCKILYKGNFSSKSFISSFILDQLIDFDARMKIFYCDFSQDANGIADLPNIDKERLKKAIDEFEHVYMGMTI